MKRPVVHATPSVALVGRKNVGKSSLFNRLIERHQAIVSDIPGTTRDVGIGMSRWRGKSLTVLDTGGLDIIKQDQIEVNVRKQALRAAEKAHAIVFVGDAQTGPLSTDVVLAKELRKSGRPVVLAVNKADTVTLRREVTDEWKKLGFGSPIAISAASGSGTGDLLDAIFAALKEAELPDEDVTPEAVVTMLGRPNVGKSSLLNAMLGEERVIVSEIPHTTREPQDTLLWYEGKPLLVVDTAGVRRRANIEPGLEKASVGKSLTAIKQSDVVLLVLDVSVPVTAQDAHLASLASESGKAVILVINKWDLVTGKTTKTADAVRADIDASLPFLTWAPGVFVSAKTGLRVQALLDLALRAKASRERTLTEEELDAFADEVVKPFVRSRTPTTRDALGARRKHLHVYGIRQTGSEPPSFMVIVKDKDTVDRSYLRFIENRLRERFGFEGTPIFVRSREIEK